MIVYSLFGEMVYSFKYNNGMQNIKKDVLVCPGREKLWTKKETEFLELAALPEFQDCYVDCLTFEEDDE